MRKGVLAGTGLAIWTVCLLHAFPGETRGDKVRTLTPDQWREDLRYFAREMPKRHKNLFHTVSREQFDQAVADLDEAIPTLARHQIIVGLSQITARVGDGHTGVHLPADFRRYPIALFWFGNELRVTAAIKEQEEALGTRVVKIGDLGMNEVQARVARCFPSAENENAWYVLGTSPAFLLRPEVLHALGVVPEVDRAKFTFENDEGRQITLELQAVPQDGSLQERLVRVAPLEPLTRQRREERFWFTWLPESKTVYTSFRGYDPLGSKAGELFRFLDDNPVDRLVIDMRQNGGGDFFKGRKHLIEPLKDRPGLNQPGKLFVIIGRQTFSAAMVNAIDFRKQTNALLVGEPAGERPNSYSENDEMTLPNSGVVVSYSTRYYKFLDEDVPAVMPDQRIDPAWEDFKAGRDPVMDWILSQRAAGSKERAEVP
jgi:hypothetical protein